MKAFQNTRGASKQAGFTLIEVILAVGILALGMTSVLGLFTFGAALTQAAELRTASANVIESVTADLEVRLFPADETGMPGEPVDLVDQEVPGIPRAKYSVVAVPVEGSPEAEDGGPLEYEVRIQVSFETRGVRRSRIYETRLLRQRSFAQRMRQRFTSKK
ncbi:MAG: prepilin-type N-terminal cleavage/methylation domain-containing protein [Planctomycetota bacterium]|nr:prepilin-type N-terminal cleavage/methylation domain-containing protein [Planctomycetota bacterium]